MALVQDIRAHILDHTIPLTSILREVMVLARKLQSDETLKWVAAELEGYRGKAELPDYRKFAAHSVGDGFIHRFMYMRKCPINTSFLPEYLRKPLDEGRINGGVGELASLLESNEQVFYHPWPTAIVAYYNSLECVDIKFHEAWAIHPRGLVEHVLDTVRTRLLHFVVEIEELNPGAGEVPSLGRITSATTNKIFEYTIMNENNFGDVHKFGNIYGGNVASGESRISSSHASYTSTTDATAALVSLKEHVSEVAEEGRAKVIEAIDLLIAAIEGHTIPNSRVVAAAETIAGASVRLKQTLRELSIGVAGSLAASGVWDGVRYAVGAK